MELATFTIFFITTFVVIFRLARRPLQLPLKALGTASDMRSLAFLALQRLMPSTLLYRRPVLPH
jgi:hypothetical protein